MNYLMNWFREIVEKEMKEIFSSSSIILRINNNLFNPKVWFPKIERFKNGKIVIKITQTFTLKFARDYLLV